ncbi:aminotransferase class IV [Acetobacter persici]|uniref:aminotransferase class IV n=1 Tax=Acetobacter persici TaxID=1076596 RepID=UPI0039E959CF
MTVVFLNGRFINEDEAMISPFDRGFTFGEGVYEVCISVAGKIIDLEEHLGRLDRSLNAAGIILPPERSSMPGLMHDLLERNGIKNGFIYIQVTPGKTVRNFIASPTERSTLLMSTGPTPLEESNAFKHGMRVQVIPDIRWGRRDIKTTMLMPQVMAKRAALDAGFDDVIFYDDLGITEGSSSNVFMVTNEGELVTRPVSHQILSGCTRNTVIELTEQNGMTVTERPITRDDLLQAKEIFLTSSTYLVVPVVELELEGKSKAYSCEETKKIQNIYMEYLNK